MCLAVPMRVLRMEGSFAVCVDGQVDADDQGGEQRIDTLITGPLAAGQWVLCFLGAAREVVDAERAAQVADALGALAALEGLMKVSPGGTAPGDDMEALIRAGFADLVDREPRLPDFLRQPN